ncbi:MAG TPA: MBL fold metallo-hydrolase [Sphingomicrobium sp.]|jgi:glyoxylase-like metal-dependent hydrolase (beta-lactamase superfamily II)|nr:MBL fold metallo-hydrolase [Sphingomicrobium sp.]
MGPAPGITAFFDEATNSVSYLIADPATGTAAVVDPVLDFDPASGRISTGSVDRILAAADERGLKIVWVLETHVHADHLSGAAVIRERTGARVGIGGAISAVQQVFGPMLGVKDLDTEDFDRRFADGDRVELGELTVEVIATPGHTPACVSYRIGDAVFVGDTLFMPDYGTARCDFPGGDAARLYQSIQRLLALPRETRLFLCHDYKAPGRDGYAWETTVGEEADRNVHIGGGTSEQEFVAMRRARDATLCAPKLLYPAIQVNIRGGRLPPAEPDGSVYLKIPITRA